MHTHAALRIVFALALVTCGRSTRTGSSASPTSAADAPLDDAQIAGVVDQLNAAEIATSELELRRGQNADLLELAQRLVTEHGDGQRELRDLLASAGFDTAPGAKIRAVARRR